MDFTLFYRLEESGVIDGRQLRLDCVDRRLLARMGGFGMRGVTHFHAFYLHPYSDELGFVLMESLRLPSELLPEEYSIQLDV